MDATLQEIASQVSRLEQRQISDDHLREAQLIQASLLPIEPLQDASVDISFLFVPRSEVSGDFVDFFRLPNGLIGLYIGDVVGKGLSAAMYGALVVGTLRGVHKCGMPAASVLRMLNERLMRRPLPGRFCCTLYAVFDPASGELEFSNAGLPRPLLISKDSCESLGEGGFPCGMFPNVIYDNQRVQLSPGDSVLFATDGLHESSNGDGAEFGTQHLAESWVQCRHKSAGESVKLLFHSLHTFSKGNRLTDDMTMLVLKVPG